jgi:hypothetical protein
MRNGKNKDEKMEEKIRRRKTRITKEERRILRTKAR